MQRPDRRRPGAKGSTRGAGGRSGAPRGKAAPPAAPRAPPPDDDLLLDDGDTLGYRIAAIDRSDGSRTSSSSVASGGGSSSGGASPAKPKGSGSKASKAARLRNDLLNFSYERPPEHEAAARAAASWAARRQQQSFPTFHKERFMLAAYRFLVRQTYQFEPHVSNANLPVDWDNIEVVCAQTLEPYNCPICLDEPLAAHMTKCGHVFCRHCLLQYFDDDTGRKWKKCPICVELISCEDSQLKSTALELVVPCKPGDSRTFVLVERMRHSTLAALRQPGEGPIGSLLYETDPSAKFSRIAIAEAVSARIDHQSLELLARAREAQQSQDLSYPYLLHVMQQMQVSNVARVASESAAQPASKPPREKRVSSNSPWSDSEDEAEPATPEVDAAASAAAAPLLDDEDAAATTATTTTTTTTTTARQPVRLSSVAESDRTLYYQSEDGQQLYIHPLTMKCLLRHYGSYDRLPLTFTARVLEIEEFSVDAATQKRYKILSHLPLTTQACWCELDVEPLLPAAAVQPFLQQIRSRATRRRKEQEKSTSVDDTPLYRRPAPIDDSYFPAPPTSSSSSSSSGSRSMSTGAQEFVPSSLILQSTAVTVPSSTETTPATEPAATTSQSSSTELDSTPASGTEASSSTAAAPAPARTFRDALSAKKPEAPLVIPQPAKSAKQRKRKQLVFLANSGHRAYS